MNFVDVVADKFARLVIRQARIREHVKQRPHAGIAAPDGVCHGHSEGVFQFLHVDLYAVTFSLVHHVKVDDERNSVFHKLNRQEKVARNVCRVNNVNYDVGLILLEIVADDFLFLRARVD